jgi:hypothetical protein
MILYTANGTTAGDQFWVDGFKMEEGTVATAWTPGFVADATVLDAGGIAIDGYAGGIFRMRGTTGGARDVVELGARSLVFGGDSPVYSPAVGTLQADAGLVATGGLATKTKAGVPTDADLATGMAVSGVCILDTTNSRLYFRVGSTWKYVTLT